MDEPHGSAMDDCVTVGWLLCVLPMNQLGTVLNDVQGERRIHGRDAKSKREEVGGWWTGAGPKPLLQGRLKYESSSKDMHGGSLFYMLSSGNLNPVADPMKKKRFSRRHERSRSP
ncbi:uncharacterized protein LOC135608466 [Musa acuminata AAA Group]|uniref:uncharacterized protein LOC135608466 n=1 Tax=Musa acuminata AAA Group TaxID=214697 RepID=UPI0031D1F2AB